MKKVQRRRDEISTEAGKRLEEGTKRDQKRYEKGDKDDKKSSKEVYGKTIKRRQGGSKVA